MGKAQLLGVQFSIIFTSYLLNVSVFQALVNKTQRPRLMMIKTDWQETEKEASYYNTAWQQHDGEAQGLMGA